MHVNSKRPVLVPVEHWAEIEKLSKAALMDLVYDYATTHCGSEDPKRIMESFRIRSAIVRAHRAQS